ncbi:N-acetyltransferase domain-containing protein [Aphis craccivora]|uniref:N-acetyltransferase domain-containing protein n=1 Tax=Aphis craccivora TaxID=307492 RepID=A0A6G0ZHL1_APHCR|nr:N-acetyltransferase domain-containing protein [Aphis craccivora]
MSKNSASSYKLYYISNDVENGTFIGILSRPEEEYPDVVVTYTCPGNEEQFRRMLFSTEHINWQKKLLFQAIPIRMNAILETTVTEKGLKSKLYFNTVLKWMPANVAARLDYETPEDVFIDKLSLDHIDFIYSQWTHSDIYPKSDLWDIVRLNISLGIFSRHNGELLAWAMCGNYGGLSTLVVQKDYRRRGFGKLIVLAVTKEMGENGVSPHALISEKNNVSLSLFKNVGYTKQSTILPCVVVEGPDTSGP